MGRADILTKGSSKDLGMLCRRRKVRRLSAFGSAARGPVDPGKSDLDILVEFEPMDPVQHANHYFELQAELQSLFGVPVDLVESSAIRNPYFRQSVEKNLVLLYEVA